MRVPMTSACAGTEGLLSKGRSSWAPAGTVRLCGAVHRWAQLQPQKTAFISGDRRIAYEELSREIDGLCSKMQQEGVRQGDRVVAILDDGIAFVVVLFAALQLDVNVVSIDHLLTGGDIAGHIAEVGPRLVFISDEKLVDVARLKKVRVVEARASGVDDWSFWGGEAPGVDSCRKALSQTASQKPGGGCSLHYYFHIRFYGEPQRRAAVRR